MDEHSQIPTIKKAVTYIVDEQGNEREVEAEVKVEAKEKPKKSQPKPEP